MSNTKYFLVIFFLAIVKCLYCQHEISLNYGFTYNDYNIINNPENIFKEINISKMQGSTNIAYSFSKWELLNSFQFGVINFNRSYYLEDSKFGYEQSNSYTFWRIGYTLGRRWFFDSKHKFSLSSSIGCNLILKQKNISFENIGDEIEYLIDSNTVNVKKENVPHFNSDICLKNSTYLKIKIFKKIGMNIGADFFIWGKSTFVDSNYSISLNSDYIGELNIKSYKPNVYIFFGLSYDL